MTEKVVRDKIFSTQNIYELYRYLSDRTHLWFKTKPIGETCIEIVCSFEWMFTDHNPHDEQEGESKIFIKLIRDNKEIAQYLVTNYKVPSHWTKEEMIIIGNRDILTESQKGDYYEIHTHIGIEQQLKIRQFKIGFYAANVYDTVYIHERNIVVGKKDREKYCIIKISLYPFIQSGHFSFIFYSQLF